MRRYHSCPKILSAVVACGVQCEKMVYAYSYVRKTVDANTITLGAQQCCSRKVKLTTAESVVEGKLRIEEKGSITASRDGQRPAGDSVWNSLRLACTSA